MKRLWGIRHVRWWLARRRHGGMVRWFENEGVPLCQYELDGFSARLDAIWNGEA